jgi:hypothetical protein
MPLNLIGDGNWLYAPESAADFDFISTANAATIRGASRRQLIAGTTGNKGRRFCGAPGGTKGSEFVDAKYAEIADLIKVVKKYLECQVNRLTISISY